MQDHGQDRQRREAPTADMPGGPDWLGGGGEMGQRIRAFDWSKTPLGPLAGWPQSLKSAVSMLLLSKAQIVLFWGPDLIALYNDAYAPVFGSKHPEALGKPARECWAEIWEQVLGPLFAGVLQTGEAFFARDRLFVLERHGYLEETYFDVSYDPVRVEEGTVGGICCIVSETTGRVLGERRLRTLRDLAAETAAAKTAEGACERAAATLAENPHDVPFALLYLLNGEGREAYLCGRTGLDPDTPSSPAVVHLSDPDLPWPLRQVVEHGKAVEVPDLPVRLGTPPGRVWPESPTRAIVLPMAKPGHRELSGCLVVGVSPRLALTDDYRGFMDLLAGHVATAIAGARAYDAERRRAEALAELDRAKTAFFSNVSHEFRTPLTLMLGPLEELLQRNDDALPAPAREQAHLAHRNALRLLKLVNTLLDFSRIEAGRIEASYEPTDLAALTAELAAVFRSAVERAGLSLAVDCPPLPEPLYVDREMWEKIVLNLLSNALKFTFAGEIGVALRPAGPMVELEVRDTGTGIPAADLPHLFERFYRVEGARGRTFEGSGIGLALVQELVRLHGGEVRVESEVNRGSRFIVSLPVGCAHLPANRIRAPRTLASTAVRGEAYVQEALRWLPDGEEPRLQVRDEVTRLEAAPPDVGRADRARILVADDNADLRQYLLRLLREQFDVVAVADGHAALEAARARPPDLVLSDAMMPGLDGFALLQALRADSRLREIPVILLSARAGEESRVEGMEAGAEDYLIKPFGARELVARVAARLEMIRLRKRAAAEREALLEQNRTQTAYLRLALRGAGAGVWVLDVSAGTTFWSEEFLPLYGYDAATPRTYGQWIGSVHPDDRARVAADFLARLESAATEFRQEFRIVHPERGVRWILDIGRIDRDADGRAIRFHGINIDITQRKQAEEALRQHAEALTDADRRKDEFLATLAHELRNPLAPIRNAVHILRLASTAGDVAEQARQTIERQLGQMIRIVDDLLDLSRITRGRIELRKERVALSSIVQSAVETSRPLIDASGHHLTVMLAPETVWLHADLTRMTQVVANLLNNAAKYSPEAGRIWLTAEREGTDAIIRVRDTGMGIPSAMLPRIFDMFRQADTSRERSHGGLGIGLTLVKRLVELHGGRVEAASAGPGHGSEFTVRLPVAVEEAVAWAPATDGDTPRRPGPARRILVVDDNRDAADSLTVLLRIMGHEVRTAHDGRAALEQIRGFRPDAALLDVGMLGMSGYELARRLRELPELRRVVLVAVTGWGQDEDRRRSREAGFDHHLTKPADPAALEALLASLPDAAPGSWLADGDAAPSPAQPA